MNLFVRYFSHEYLAKTAEEAVDFLKDIPEIKVDNNVVARITAILNSNSRYPYRLKVSFSNYVLFLKTEAETLEAFKIEEQARNEQKKETEIPATGFQSMADRKKEILETLKQHNEGWYDASMLIKRVVLEPVSQKFRYIDTRFRVKCKATSAMHCYERMVEYLKTRDDIDPRSQFPSAKSQNFEYTFLGENVEI